LAFLSMSQAKASGPAIRATTANAVANFFIGTPP
jgi:hypothetical protein